MKDLIYGIRIVNRSGVKEKSTIGMFISTAPITVKMDESESFIELCRQIGREHKVVFKHHKYPYDVLLNQVREAHGINHDLFDISVSYQNAKISKISNESDFNTNWYFNGTLQESLALHIDDRDDDGCLVINIDYLEELFNEREIGYIYKRLINILQQGIKFPAKRYCEFQMVDEEEKRQLLVKFNNTKVDYII